MIRSGLGSLRFADRLGFLLESCRGKRVLHLGATDAPETRAAIRDGRFLHGQLKGVAAELVGIDNNRAMIEVLSEQYGVNDILLGDIEVAEDYPDDSFDVVIAGEILEHLNNPGRALNAVRQRMTDGAVLIVTVPNAYSFKGFMRAVVGHELIHPDHVLHHSLHTLSELLRRHGFTVHQSFGFVNGGTGRAAALTNWSLRHFPQLAEGIGVVCVPTVSEAPPSIRP